MKFQFKNLCFQRSELPSNPIENPMSWAWGRHPRNGFGYKAKDSLAVEVGL